MGNELYQREKHYSVIKATPKASIPSVAVNEFNGNPFVKETDQMGSVQVVRRNNDEESLVPVESDTENQWDDSSSFVIQSAPNSADTFATTRSIDDDIVLVGTLSKRSG